MFWLRMGKNLGFISRKKFEEIISIKPIEELKVFDKKWYFEQYPDVKKLHKNPITHYLETGWKIGYNPSPLFNNNAYLKDYPDVDAAKMCPLIHYINHGHKEGRYVHSIDGGVGLKIIPKEEENDKKDNSLKDKLLFLLQYPVRVQDEYFYFKQEVEKLKK